MANREIKRRLLQQSNNFLNQQDRGIEMFAPSGASMEYCVGVYPLVSRRGRIIPSADRY
jgi:hypothetical protein